MSSDRLLKIISASLIVVMLLQDISWAASEIAGSVERIANRKTTFEISPEIGTVEEKYRASFPHVFDGNQADPRPRGDDKTIYLIQDAHTNESAQRNIAKILDALIVQKRIKTVFLEAGTGDDSLSALRPLAPLSKRISVSDIYLKKAWIQGPDHLDLTSDREFKLWGVEDKPLYFQGIDLYRKIAKKREVANSYLAKIRRTIEFLKSKHFNPLLHEFDGRRAAFHRSELSLTEYFSVLSEEAQKEGISLLGYPNLLSLKALRDKEAKIDFKKADEEQKIIFRSLSAEDKEEFVRASRSDAISKAGADNTKSLCDFYAALSQRIPNVREFAEFSRYLEYLEAARKIDLRALLDETQNLENGIYAAKTKTSEEAELLGISASEEILSRVINLKALSSDLTGIEADPQRFEAAEMGGRLNRFIMELESRFEEAVFLNDDYEEVFSDSLEFYRLTERRDEVFVRNILARMETENENEAAFVVGGFHIKNLKKLLREKNISYVSIVPAVLGETNHKKYERILLSQIQHKSGSSPMMSVRSFSKMWNTLPGAELAVGRMPVAQMLRTEFAGARLSEEETPSEEPSEVNDGNTVIHISSAQLLKYASIFIVSALTIGALAVFVWFYWLSSRASDTEISRKSPPKAETPAARSREIQKDQEVILEDLPVPGGTAGFFTDDFNYSIILDRNYKVSAESKLILYLPKELAGRSVVVNLVMRSRSDNMAGTPIVQATQAIKTDGPTEFFFGESSGKEFNFLFLEVEGLGSRPLNQAVSKKLIGKGSRFMRLDRGPFGLWSETDRPRVEALFDEWRRFEDDRISFRGDSLRERHHRFTEALFNFLPQDRQIGLESNPQTERSFEKLYQSVKAYLASIGVDARFNGETFMMEGERSGTLLWAPHRPLDEKSIFTVERDRYGNEKRIEWRRKKDGARLASEETRILMSFPDMRGNPYTVDLSGMDVEALEQFKELRSVKVPLHAITLKMGERLKDLIQFLVDKYLSKPQIGKVVGLTPASVAKLIQLLDIDYEAKSDGGRPSKSLDSKAIEKARDLASYMFEGRYLSAAVIARRTNLSLTDVQVIIKQERTTDPNTPKNGARLAQSRFEDHGIQFEVNEGGGIRSRMTSAAGDTVAFKVKIPKALRDKVTGVRAWTDLDRDSDDPGHPVFALAETGEDGDVYKLNLKTSNPGGYSLMPYVTLRTDEGIEETVWAGGESDNARVRVLPRWTTQGMNTMIVFIRNLRRPGTSFGRSGNFTDLHWYLQELSKLGFTSVMLLPFTDPFEKSPYESYSAFSIDPNYIDWEKEPAMKEMQGLSAAERLEWFRDNPSKFEDVGSSQEFNEFLKNEHIWHYADAKAVHYLRTDGKTDWPSESVRLEARGRPDYSLLYGTPDNPGLYLFEQYIAFRQLKAELLYAKEIGLRLILDQPFFQSTRGAFAMHHEDLILKDKNGKALEVIYDKNPYEEPQIWKGQARVDHDRFKETGYRFILEIFDHWLDAGFSGFRLDAAHMTGSDFHKVMNKEVLQKREGVLGIAEQAGGSEEEADSLEQNGFLLYHMTDYVVRGGIAGLLYDIQKNAKDYHLRLNTTHDTARLLSVFAPIIGDSRSAEEARKKALAVIALFAFSQENLTLQQGDEIGQTDRINTPGYQEEDWEAGSPADPDSFRYDIGDEIQRMIEMRQANPALRAPANFVLLSDINDPTVVFSRSFGDQTLIVCVNLSPTEKTIDTGFMRPFSVGPWDYEIRAIGHSAIAPWNRQVLSAAKYPIVQLRTPHTDIFPDLSGATRNAMLALHDSGKVGSGDKEAIDQEATDILRHDLQKAAEEGGYRLVSVNSEGEKDYGENVPGSYQMMLIEDESFGPDDAETSFELTSDSVDGTSNAAKYAEGREGRVSAVLAVGDKIIPVSDRLRALNLSYNDAGKDIPFDLSAHKGEKELEKAFVEFVKEYVQRTGLRPEEVTVHLLGAKDFDNKETRKPHRHQLFYDLLNDDPQLKGIRFDIFTAGTVTPQILAGAVPGHIYFGIAGSTETFMAAQALARLSSRGARSYTMISSDNGYHEVVEKDGFYEKYGQERNRTDMNNRAKFSSHDIGYLKNAKNYFSEDDVKAIQNGDYVFSSEKGNVPPVNFYQTLYLPTDYDFPGKGSSKMIRDSGYKEDEKGILIRTLEIDEKGLSILEETLNPARVSGARLGQMTSKAARRVSWTLASLVHRVLFSANMTTIGEESLRNLPKDKPVIFVANHMARGVEAVFVGPIVFNLTRRLVRFTVNPDMVKPGVLALSWLTGGIPVYPKKHMTVFSKKDLKDNAADFAGKQKLLKWIGWNDPSLYGRAKDRMSESIEKNPKAAFVLFPSGMPKKNPRADIEEFGRSSLWRTLIESSADVMIVPMYLSGRIHPKQSFASLVRSSLGIGKDKNKVNRVNIRFLDAIRSSDFRESEQLLAAVQKSMRDAVADEGSKKGARLADKEADEKGRASGGIGKRMAIAFLVLTAAGLTAYSFGVFRLRESFIEKIIANIFIFTIFTGLTDYLVQWALHGRVDWKIVKKALWPTGPFLGVVTAIGFYLIDLIIPKDMIIGWLQDMPWLNRFVVTNIRIIGSFLVVKARTVIYAGSSGGEKSQEKQKESFWISRPPSYGKYFVIQAPGFQFDPAGVDGLLNQFFQLFYSWSVYKPGFMIKDGWWRSSRLFLMTYFFVGPVIAVVRMFGLLRRALPWETYSPEELGLERVPGSAGYIRYKDGYAPPSLKFGLIVVPHGLTPANRGGLVFMNHVNDPYWNRLTEEGEKQAKDGAEVLFEDIGPEIIKNPENYIILTTPLDRTEQTAKPFLELLSSKGVNVHKEVFPAAIETNFGEWDGHADMKSMNESLRGLVERYRAGDAFVHAENGESFVMLLDRVRQVIDELNAKYPGKTVILYGHGTFTQALKVIMRTEDVDALGKDYIRWNQIPKERGYPNYITPKGESGSRLAGVDVDPDLWNRWNDLREDVAGHWNNAKQSLTPSQIRQMDLVAKLAMKAHEGHMRKDGKRPYFVHPLEVAETLFGVFGVADPIAIQIALLHDTREDRREDYERILTEIYSLVNDDESLAWYDKLRTGVRILTQPSGENEIWLYDSFNDMEYEDSESEDDEDISEDLLDEQSSGELGEEDLAKVYYGGFNALRNVYEEVVDSSDVIDAEYLRYVSLIKLSDRLVNSSDFPYFFDPSFRWDKISEDKRKKISDLPFKTFQKTLDHLIPFLINKSDHLRTEDVEAFYGRMIQIMEEFSSLDLYEYPSAKPLLTAAEWALPRFRQKVRETPKKWDSPRLKFLGDPDLPPGNSADSWIGYQREVHSLDKLIRLVSNIPRGLRYEIMVTAEGWLLNCPDQNANEPFAEPIRAVDRGIYKDKGFISLSERAQRSGEIARGTAGMILDLLEEEIRKSDPSASLSDRFKGRSILIVGPGPTLAELEALSGRLGDGAAYSIAEASSGNIVELLRRLKDDPQLKRQLSAIYHYPMSILDASEFIEERYSLIYSMNVFSPRVMRDDTASGSDSLETWHNLSDLLMSEGYLAGMMHTLDVSLGYPDEWEGIKKNFKVLRGNSSEIIIAQKNERTSGARLAVNKADAELRYLETFIRVSEDLERLRLAEDANSLPRNKERYELLLELHAEREALFAAWRNSSAAYFDFMVRKGYVFRGERGLAEIRMLNAFAGKHFKEAIHVSPLMRLGIAFGVAGFALGVSWFFEDIWNFISRNLSAETGASNGQPSGTPKAAVNELRAGKLMNSDGSEKALVYFSPSDPAAFTGAEASLRSFEEMIFGFPKMLRDAAARRLPLILVVEEDLEGRGPLDKDAPRIEGQRVMLALASVYFRFQELGNTDVRVLRVPKEKFGDRASIESAVKRLASVSLPEPGPSESQNENAAFMEGRLFSYRELSEDPAEGTDKMKILPYVSIAVQPFTPSKVIDHGLPALKEGQKRALITGGAGFIGYHLTKKLLAEGHQVIVLDNFSSGLNGNIEPFNDSPNFYFENWDVSKPYGVPGKLDEVYHLASLASPAFYYKLPLETMSAGLEASMNTAELARLHRAKFVFASTSEVYGDPDRSAVEQEEAYAGRVNPIGRRSQYDESKRGAETLLKLLFEKHGTDIRFVRIFNTYGPFMRPDDGRVVSNFIVQALNKEPMTLYGDGSQTRSFGYVEDTVNGIVALMRSPLVEKAKFIENRVYNIGNPGEFTIRELAEKVNQLAQKHLGYQVPVIYLEQHDKDDPKHRKPDITRAATVLGYRPVTTLGEGLERTFLHFKETAGMSGQGARLAEGVKILKKEPMIERVEAERIAAEVKERKGRRMAVRRVLIREAGFLKIAVENVSSQDLIDQILALHFNDAHLIAKRPNRANTFWAELDKEMKTYSNETLSGGIDKFKKIVAEKRSGLSGARLSGWDANEIRVMSRLPDKKAVLDKYEDELESYVEDHDGYDPIKGSQLRNLIISYDPWADALFEVVMRLDDELRISDLPEEVRDRILDKLKKDISVLEGEIYEAIPTGARLAEKSGRLSLVSGLSAKIAAFFIGVALAFPSVSEARIPLKEQTNTPGVVRQFVRHGNTVTVITPNAEEIRLDLSNKARSNRRTERTKDAQLSQQDWLLKLDDKVRAVTGPADQANVETDRRLILEVDLKMVQNASAAHVQLGLSELKKLMKSRDAANVLLVALNAGKEGQDPVFTKEIPADYQDAKRVRLALPENLEAGYANIPVQELGPEDMTSLELLGRFAIWAGRIDPERIPEPFLNAYSTLAGRQVSREELSSVLAGRELDPNILKLLMIKPLLEQVIMGAKLADMRRRMVEQAA